MLEMAVLGLLKEQDMHGYELKKRLADVFGLSSAVSFGSLYPALARLETAGAVSVVEAAPSDSRRRKVYGITPVGAQMFEDLLATSQGSGEDERAFSLRLAFARYLPPEGRLGLLEQRRAVLGERLAQLAARARARRDDRYMRVLADRQRDALSRDVSWLEDLIRQERSEPQPGEGLEASETSSPTGPRPSPLSPGPPALATGPRSGPTPDGPLPTAWLERRSPTWGPRLVPVASASQLKRASRRPLTTKPPTASSAAPDKPPEKAPVPPV